MLKRLLPIFVAIAVAIATLAPTSLLAADGMAKSTQFWWPELLDLEPLRAHDARSNPYGDDFDYAEAFNSVDIKALKNDIEETLTASQDWWPADWGHYGGLMIRMSGLGKKSSPKSTLRSCDLMIS